MSLKKPRILLLTANDWETRLVKEQAKSITRLDPQFLYLGDHTVLRLGDVGGVEIGLARTEQGTESPGGATLTVLDIIDSYQPEAIVMVGVCFGLKPRSQNIGQVLVSSQIRLYDPKKVTEDGGIVEVTLRGDKVQASPRLLDRFRAGTLNWDGDPVEFGLMLCGNTLVNSQSVVRFLRKEEPDAVGGEMEGAGLYVASAKRRVDWIIVKAIADWGIGKKDHDQALAARNAARYALHVVQMGGLAVSRKSS